MLCERIELNLYGTLEETHIVPFVFSVHVGSMLQQQLHCLHTIITRGQMQRRGLKPTNNPFRNTYANYLFKH